MRTLVLVFHPHLDRSRVNRALMDVAAGVDGVTVVDDRIVLQFPFYWYSSPALLKQWEDAVLQAGWAYGGGRALVGKEFMVAVSTGSPAESYARDGSHVRTMEELLSPFETTFRHTHATYLEPFLVQGVASSSDEQLDRVIAGYSAVLVS